MKKSGSNIVGLPVMCLDEGFKIMDIKDIIYCNEGFKVIGFLVDEGGYFREGRMIPFEKVVNIGENSVIVQNQRSIISTNEEINSLPTRGKLIGLEVVTNDGNNVGLVQDILIEFPVGRLLGIILTEGIFDDLVEGRPILPLHHSFNMNDNAIVINQSTNESIVHNTGGFKKIFSLE